MPLIDPQEILKWADRELPGSMVHVERQVRDTSGRPAWYLTRDEGGTEKRYYVRGDRSQFGFSKHYNLKRECDLMQVLYREGIRVPRVIAYSPDLRTAIHEFVPGEGDFNKATDPAQREALKQDFMQQVVAWQSIDLRLFEEIGFAVPRTAEDFLLNDLTIWEAQHIVKEPVPMLTFVSRWLRRNVPPAPERPVLVQADTGPGQFLFEGSRVTAVVDWELAFIGDPMRELSALRLRDYFFPTGDLKGWFDLYGELSGQEIDLDRIRYYSVENTAITPFGCAAVTEDLDPGDEHVEWLTQYATVYAATAQTLMEATHVTAEPPDLPDYEPDLKSHIFHILEDNLRLEQQPHVQDPYRRHRLTQTLRLLAHARNIALLGPQVEEMELDDLASILGTRPPTQVEGMRALDGFVRSSGPEHDDALIRYFFRHSRRQLHLMRGALGRVEGASGLAAIE